MKVVIIGSGNAATILGRKIDESGHEIVQVVSRNVESANRMSAFLNIVAVYNIRHINLLADIYLIAVSDSSIGLIAADLQLNDKIVVHTAAAVSKEVLATVSTNYGILYPLQTLTSEMVTLPPIPVLIDGNNEKTIETLREFADRWADNVQVANDEERLKLHVAAVLVNNFTNHLFTIVKEYCEKERLNFSLLYPLIEETVKRIKENNPAFLQTGPARRKDFVTIEKHYKLLEEYPKVEELYKLFTNSIIDFYGNKQ